MGISTEPKLKRIEAYIITDLMRNFFPGSTYMQYYRNTVLQLSGKHANKILQLLLWPMMIKCDIMQLPKLIDSYTNQWWFYQYSTSMNSLQKLWKKEKSNQWKRCTVLTKGKKYGKTGQTLYVTSTGIQMFM